ncbi:hypothetical protein [Pseudomonas abieticivorans]|uniref:hypothetical protein n=1 Tax=Pseudomonas abieticivorans TaxID=2931382 RepID=UPI0020BDDEAD|nr:hypothetical protein [Pseudomonas sp. PIA16]
MFIYDPKDLERRLRIIDDITIPPPVAASRAAASTQSFPSATRNDTALVLNASILAFKQGISDESNLDVIQATYFAEQSASLKYDSRREAKAWNAVFANTLATVGWRYAKAASYFSSPAYPYQKQRLLNVIYAIGGKTCAQLTEQSMAALPANLRAKQLFERNTYNPESTRFNLLACLGNDRGDLQQAFTSASTHGPTPTSLDMIQSIRCEVTAMTLPAGAYAEFREVVRKKIQAIREDMFEAIKL